MNIFFKGIRYKIHNYMFYISYKNFFSAKAILEFFKLFYLNFNLEQYVRKKIHINYKNFVPFCRNLALKLVQEH